MEGEAAASQDGKNITPTIEEKDFNKNRFEVELEVSHFHGIDLYNSTQPLPHRQFLQALSNPNYLHALATSAYLTDPCFLNYLEYLLEYLRTVEGGVEFVM